MRKHRFWILVWLTLVTGVGVLWLFLREPDRQTIVLPDGSKLTLLKVTYGANHSCAYGNGWREWIYPAMPHKIRTNLAAKVGMLTSTETNGVVVWVLRAGSPSLTNFHRLPLPKLQSSKSSELDEALSVVDEHRLESSLIFPKASYDVKLGTGVSAYELGNHPRRAETLSIRVYWRKGPDRRIPCVGEFTIPNRLQRGFPRWTPQPLPVTRATNGLGIKLVKFETGLQESEARMFAAVADGARAFTRATFAINENGTAGSDWSVNAAELSSATGDAWPMQSSASWGQGLSSVDFLGSLWSEEPAFKLRLSLSRAGDRRYRVAVEFVAKPEAPNAPRPGP